MHASFGIKLGVVGVVLAAPTLGVGWVTARWLTEIQANLHAITEVHGPSADAAHELEINLLGTGFAVLGYLDDRDPRHLERIADDQQDFKRFQQRLHDLADSPEMEAMTARADEGYARFQALGRCLTRDADARVQRILALIRHLNEIDDLLDDHLQVSIDDDMPDAYDKLSATLEMEINVNGIAKGMGSYLWTQDAQFKARIDKDEQDFLRFHALYCGLAGTAAERDLAAAVRGHFDTIMVLAHEVIELTDAAQADLRELVTVRRDMDALLDEEIQTLAQRDLSRASAAGLAAIGQSRAASWTTAIAAFTFELLLLGIVVWLSRREKLATARVVAMASQLRENEQDLRRSLRNLHKSEQSLRALNDQLAQHNRDLEEFTYVASHDLQEPLRKLVSFSKLLPEDMNGEMTDQAASDVAYINDAAMRMQALVSDLLALSRTGNGALKHEPLSPDACIDEALQALAAQVDATRPELTRDALPEVLGDRTLVRQLYQNLIGNALKFVRPGVRPQVHLTVEHRDGEVVFGVRDNGIGISPEHCEAIFAPFKRLHECTEYPGTGIGLAICRRAVERMGGRIWVESTPGRGSHFQFTLKTTEVTATGQESTGLAASCSS
jgi:signal transduction histidine kinase